MFQNLSYQRIALTATLLWSCHTSYAQQSAFTPNATVLKGHINYVVQGDGRYTKEEITEIRINTDQGVKQRSQFQFPYSSTLQELKIIKAFTITPDGRRIDVKPEDILEQQSPISANAPMFDDYKVKVVVFPAVAIGSRLGVHVMKTQKIPLFKGRFYDLEAAWPDSDFKSFEISIQAPRAMKLQVVANKMKGGEVSSPDSAQQVWKWPQENLPAVAPEMAATSPHERIAHVAMTNFTSYAEAAIAYEDRAQAKSAVTPGIQKLADEITQGVTDRRQQAQALYHWVNHNIRYVAIFLGFGGVLPHDAQAVADARYGDCKDKTTLLQALLAAKGIARSTALINATDVYWLPSIAMPTTAFNHAITFIPEFNLFLDTTPGKAMFGVLSPQLMGKTALVTRNANGLPVLMKVPVAKPEEHGVKIVTRMTLNAQGDISGESVIQSRGMLGIQARLIMQSFPPGVEPRVASQLLAMSGQNGSGTIVHEGADDT
jgi:transglutaminase-like putative cysteine protease